MHRSSGWRDGQGRAQTIREEIASVGGVPMETRVCCWEWSQQPRGSGSQQGEACPWLRGGKHEHDGCFYLGCLVKERNIPCPSVLNA